MAVRRSVKKLLEGLEQAAQRGHADRELFRAVRALLEKNNLELLPADQPLPGPNPRGITVGKYLEGRRFEIDLTRGYLKLVLNPEERNAIVDQLVHVLSAGPRLVYQAADALIPARDARAISVLIDVLERYPELSPEAAERVATALSVTLLHSLTLPLEPAEEDLLLHAANVLRTALAVARTESMKASGTDHFKWHEQLAIMTRRNLQELLEGFGPVLRAKSEVRPADLAETSEERHQRALEYVREQYEHAAGMMRLNVERLNEHRPPGQQYSSTSDLVREFLSMAGAVNNFAVHMDLISPDDSLRIILDFHRAHPKLNDSAEDRAWMDASREKWLRARRRRRRRKVVDD